MRDKPITMPSCWRARVVCWITVSSFSFLWVAPPPPPSPPLGAAIMLSMSVMSSIPSWPITTVASTITDPMTNLLKQVIITAMFMTLYFLVQLPTLLFCSLGFGLVELAHSLEDTWRQVKGGGAPITRSLPAFADKAWQKKVFSQQQPLHFASNTSCWEKLWKVWAKAKPNLERESEIVIVNTKKTVIGLIMP